jgi:tetratricopeptide (TPR) repeat protein
MVDKVTDLSPQFRIIYATVPLLLAITVNDIQGAIELLDKGVRYFPNDWPILYRGGYLYLYERGDKTKAAEYFLRAQKSGGPDWLATLATRLYSESGRLEMVQQLVKEYEQLGFPPGLLARMRERLDEVSKTIK